MPLVREFAPAKVNLALHVTGRRSDGYHLLDTLVAFACVGDELTFEPADRLTLAVTVPAKNDLTVNDDNLVLRAARALMASTKASLPGVAITLRKNLPVASGIGGGSADAAAALRGLNRFWALERSTARLADTGLPLGADLPMCLTATPLRAGGVGAQVQPVSMPAFELVLVNPRVPLATPRVFLELAGKYGRGLPPPPQNGHAAWFDYLGSQRNDLQAAAVTLEPRISACIDALQTVGHCQLARMSGSGATCFGLFADSAQAALAASTIATEHPNWWVVATRTMAS